MAESCHLDCQGVLVLCMGVTMVTPVYRAAIKSRDAYRRSLLKHGIVR